VVESVPIDSIERHPENARTHNIDIIAESLLVHGQFQPLIVQKSTGLILAGNGRHEAAERIGVKDVDVIYLDVDDEEALRILLVDNRSSDLGGYDNTQLLSLLQRAGSLEGTGFLAEDVDDLIALLQEKPDETSMVGRDPQGGISERSLGYLTRSVRSILLDYEGQEFLWVIDRLTELRHKFEVNTNAEAVRRVLIDLFPDNPPPE
jgi:hypothetical protein